MQQQQQQRRHHLVRNTLQCLVDLLSLKDVRRPLVQSWLRDETLVSTRSTGVRGEHKSRSHEPIHSLVRRSTHAVAAMPAPLSVADKTHRLHTTLEQFTSVAEGVWMHDNQDQVLVLYEPNPLPSDVLRQGVLAYDVELLRRFTQSVPIQNWAVSELEHLLDQPVWHDYAGGVPELTPRMVLKSMDRYLVFASDIRHADLSSPILMMMMGANIQILDGMYQLCRCVLEGERFVAARIVTPAILTLALIKEQPHVDRLDYTVAKTSQPETWTDSTWDHIREAIHVGMMEEGTGVFEGKRMLYNNYGYFYVGAFLLRTNRDAWQAVCRMTIDRNGDHVSGHVPHFETLPKWQSRGYGALAFGLLLRVLYETDRFYHISLSNAGQVAGCVIYTRGARAAGFVPFVGPEPLVEIDEDFCPAFAAAAATPKETKGSDRDRDSDSDEEEDNAPDLVFVHSTHMDTLSAVQPEWVSPAIPLSDLVRATGALSESKKQRARRMPLDDFLQRQPNGPAWSHVKLPHKCEALHRLFVRAGFHIVLPCDESPQPNEFTFVMVQRIYMDKWSVDMRDVLGLCNGFEWPAGEVVTDRPVVWFRMLEFRRHARYWKWFKAQWPDTPWLCIARPLDLPASTYTLAQDKVVRALRDKLADTSLDIYFL